MQQVKKAIFFEANSFKEEDFKIHNRNTRFNVWFGYNNITKNMRGKTNLTTNTVIQFSPSSSQTYSRSSLWKLCGRRTDTYLTLIHC